MLKLIHILNITEKKRILQDFNPDNSLWVTTDIKSQLFILNQLHKNKSSINNNCITRATDFWSYLLSIIHPEQCVINRPFLTFIYHEWAKSRKQEWQKNRETGNLICQYMEALAHLLQHPLKDSLIAEWQKNSKKELYWFMYYDLASDFWSYLTQKKIIEYSWVAAFLLDQIPFKHIKYKEIIFDLGFDINKVETELIRQIASKINTKVLIPFCFKKKTHNYIHSVYSHLFNQKKIFSSTKQSNTFFHSTKTKKFATPLAEVKDISCQIKTALKKGIEPNKICVLAPHIEDYWTCLKSYLKKEGIPVNKTETVSLHSFPVVQLWLAKMWTHLAVINYENLETIHSHQNQHTHFSKLKSEFYNIKKIEDWPPEVYTKNQLRNKDELITLSVFIQWASELLPHNISNTIVHQSIKECLNNFPKSTNTIRKLQLKWQSWLNLLEFFLKNKEIEIHAGDPDGINCLSFNAISWVESDFIYIVGLSEQNLKTEKHTVISSLQTHSIMKDLGFFIKSEPIDKMEQTISCFIHQGHKKLILSFSSTDFLGTPLNPSCLWLETAIEQKKNISLFDTPGTSLWDQQQRKSSVKEILAHHNIKQAELELVEKSIKEDLGYKGCIPFSQGEINTLSPSSLDDYVNCPFIFAAKKIFHLWDGPERDVDIPAMEHGNIVHKLFEILQLKKQNELSEQNILQIIENIKNSKSLKKITKIHPIIWEKEKSYLLKKALLFLEQEKRNKSIFKNYQTIACEKKYQCYWSFKKKSLNAKGDIAFTGKIDRIDSNNKCYQIIDYKRSTPTGAVITSWATQENFQMAFYMQVLELGLSDLSPLPVTSALYLSYKNFDYQGLAIKEPAYIQLLGSSKKRSLVSEEKKESILRDVNKKINSFILNIHKGKFPAQPKVKNLCTKCRWRKICRASHLN